MKTLLDQLPATIVLPPVDAPRVGGAGGSPADIAGQGDLPQRLFFGDLDSSRCAFREPGKWSACYASYPGNTTELRFDGDALSLAMNFLGERIESCSHPETLDACEPAATKAMRRGPLR